MYRSRCQQCHVVLAHAAGRLWRWDVHLLNPGPYGFVLWDELRCFYLHCFLQYEDVAVPIFRKSAVCLQTETCRSARLPPVWLSMR